MYVHVCLYICENIFSRGMFIYVYMILICGILNDFYI